jgi:hypothetical protein
MAFRAARLVITAGEKESLEAIAADTGVSRETVRRARNDLLAAIEAATEAPSHHIEERTLSLRKPEPYPEPATVRALRRLLTMTGPLPWDQALSAWSRAQGKHPYLPLPTDMTIVSRWTLSPDGLVVTPPAAEGEALTISVKNPEPLDRVSAFLLDALRGKSAGIGRSALFEAAKRVGLKPTTIATTLSYHPAVVRCGSSTWALRGLHRGQSEPEASTPSRRRGSRRRPTRFRWASNGELVLEFYIPRGPSPVVAVPTVIADLVEARTFTIEAQGRTGRLSISKARLWGFGALVSEVGLTSGQRAQLSLDLLAGSATLSPVPTQKDSDDDA